MKLSKLLIIAAVALAVGAVSCKKDESAETKSYSLELADALDKDIILGKEDNKSFEVKLVTDLDKDQILITEKEGKTWCSASVEDASTIKVTPGTNFEKTDLTATFVVSATGVDGVAPIEFKVTRTGQDTKYFIEISSEDLVVKEDPYMGELLTYPAAAKEPKSLTITVKTNAPVWYFKDNNMVTDDNYEPVEWYTVDKTGGRNGETITVTFTENSSISTRQSTLYFDVEAIDGMMPFTDTYKQVTVSQSPVPATKVAFAFEDKEISTGYAVEFGKDDNSRTGAKEFTITTDGGFNAVFVTTGTNTPEPTFDGTNDWVFASQDTYDATIFKLAPMPNNTGSSRTVDLIITPSGSDTELFRFKISQKGA